MFILFVPGKCKKKLKLGKSGIMLWISDWLQFKLFCAHSVVLSLIIFHSFPLCAGNWWEDVMLETELRLFESIHFIFTWPDETYQRRVSSSLNVYVTRWNADLRFSLFRGCKFLSSVCWCDETNESVKSSRTVVEQWSRTGWRDQKYADAEQNIYQLNIPRQFVIIVIVGFYFCCN